jgi:ornithine--oxo-acid transaminase
VEVDAKYHAHDICLKLLKHGILTKETHNTVIRFAPPLIISKEQIDVVVNALKQVFAEAEVELA